MNEEHISNMLDEIRNSIVKKVVVLDKDHARFLDWNYVIREEDFLKDQCEVEAIKLRFNKVFDYAVKYWSKCFGDPLQMFKSWDREKPAWAGELYSRWNVGSDFYVVFMSWENPEDPFFLLAAKAPVSEFQSEPGNYSNPWNYQWGA